MYDLSKNVNTIRKQLSCMGFGCSNTHPNTKQYEAPHWTPFFKNAYIQSGEI